MADCRTKNKISTLLAVHPYQLYPYAYASCDTNNSKTCVHKDRNITFITSSRADDLDLETVILCNRTLMLRRAIAKEPKLAIIAKEVLNRYIEHDYAGTNVNNIDQNLAEVAPLPGQRYRQAWLPFFPPMGPIGILLCQLHEKAAAISKGFKLHCHGWPTIDLLKCPFKELKTTGISHCK